MGEEDEGEVDVGQESVGDNDVQGDADGDPSLTWPEDLFWLILS